jgi:Myotubularin-like phosphatase domain
MVGLKQNRSIQDEKLVEAIFSSGSLPASPGYPHLILDARPSANAMAQTAFGAGTENAENYKGSRIVYLGIDNIHVVRDSMNRLFEGVFIFDAIYLISDFVDLACTSFESPTVVKSSLDRSGWLKHIKNILDGALMTVQSVHINNVHVLVHCRYPLRICTFNDPFTTR